MAGVKFSRKELEKHIKLTKEVEEKISLMGTHLESVTDEEIEVEITPNRPDLFSLHGFVRALLAFTEKKPGIADYKVNKPEKNYEVIVDKSVLDVRPYTACAIIKGLEFDSEKIKELMNIQEKLHATLGRNRKKIAIGVYPLEKITLPIKFEARAPEDIKFQPLEASHEMTGKQILQQHPTGRDYAHLLEGKKQYPIFVDATGEILSMPPIINSHKTGKIEESTKEIFIECSGFDFAILRKTLNILATMFADMGGKIYQMKVEHKKANFYTPDLEPLVMKLKTENVNKLLGLELTEKEIKACLEKMGYEYNKEEVKIPAWRTDILHEHDLIEDVAIGYGYDKFQPEIPSIATAGEESKIEIQKRKISEILTGLGLIEISSYHLTTPDDQFKIIGQKKEGVIELANSKTEYNILRQNLLHFSLKTLRENVDEEYPQKIFELGTVFNKTNDEKSETGIKETERLCVAIAGQTAGFTEMKQIMDYLTRMLGKNYKVESASNSFFTEGRCAKIIVDGKVVGHLGEILPNIISNLSIKMPVAALEIDIEELIK